jgi:DNA-binding LacI/PurR family transcriptional regulator
MRITLRELAKAAGVSVTTASRVLSESDHAVSSEARERVLRLANELRYKPNVSARILRIERSFTVGILANDITSYFTPIIIRGVQDTLKDAGYFCVITSFDGDISLQNEAIDALISRGMDGVIFVESWQYSAVPYLQAVNKPYVFCERLFGTKIANSVVTDNCDGAYQAVKHLIDAGHRRIGFINGPDNYYFSHERLQGYRRALSSSRIVFDPQLISQADWNIESGYRAAKQLIGIEDRPTAIFAGNDLIAVGVIYAFQEAGINVPRELAVVGYDDQPVATMFRPRLTTVTLPCYEMGREAASLLLKQMEEGQESADEIVLKGSLIVRDSCGIHLT